MAFRRKSRSRPRGAGQGPDLGPEGGLALGDVAGELGPRGGHSNPGPRRPQPRTRQPDQSRDPRNERGRQPAECDGRGGQQEDEAHHEPPSYRYWFVDDFIFEKNSLGCFHICLISWFVLSWFTNQMLMNFVLVLFKNRF